MVPAAQVEQEQSISGDLDPISRVRNARLSQRRQFFAVPAGAADRLRVARAPLLLVQGGDHGFKQFPVSLDSGPVVVVVDLGLAITGSDPKPHPRMCRP